jgi:hypothetical protein
MELGASKREELNQLALAAEMVNPRAAYMDFTHSFLVPSPRFLFHQLVLHVPIRSRFHYRVCMDRFQVTKGESRFDDISLYRIVVA